MEKLMDIINSTVIDEFFHKLVLFEVYSKKKLTSQEAIKFLKSNPDYIKKLDQPFKASREVLNDYGFKIIDTSKHLDETLDISMKYGLLFSDALHCTCCKVCGIENIATNVDFLKMWKP
ncbi:MAG: PIN domain-containing protein [Candidatus Methanoperedens sp.]|nr:PIN domain-containing protein [Candidatus Methanoperedens sp.]